MGRKVEQASVKFCVELGKSVTETLNMLRQAYGYEAMSVCKVSTGTGASKVEERPLKMMGNLEHLPRASPSKMWNEFGNLFMQIVGR
jgi:hypothetical protein